MFKHRYLLCGLLWCIELFSMVAHNPKQNLLCIVDMSVSDIIPDRAVILEFAAIVADANFRLQNEIYHVIHHPSDIASAVHPFFKNHYIKSGLLERVEHSKSTLQDAERALLEAFPEDAYNPLLCGGDNIQRHRLFLKQYMPHVESKLSNRMPLLVSSIRSFVRLSNPEDSFTRSESANSLEAVHSLFEELKYYRYRYFTQPFLADVQKNNVDGFEMESESTS